MQLSSPRLRGEGCTPRATTRSRPGEGAFPPAQTRGGAPSPDALCASTSPRKRGEGAPALAATAAAQSAVAPLALIGPGPFTISLPPRLPRYSGERDSGGAGSG